MSFARFMSSTTGRAIRVIAGLAIIIWGFAAGIPALVVVGLVPLAAGAFNVCLIAPLLKAPFSGKSLSHRS
jgi:Protein of unknown function (DUF2892)